MSETHRCSGQVQDTGGWGRFYSCDRKGSIQEAGKWWCKTHAPSAVQAREDASRAKRLAKEAAYRIDWDRRAAKDKIVEVARKVFRQEATHAELEGAVAEYERLAALASEE
jgi:hypothetical protein